MDCVEKERVGMLEYMHMIASETTVNFPPQAIINMRLICAVAMAIKLTFLIIPLLFLDDKKKRLSTVIFLT